VRPKVRMARGLFWTMLAVFTSVASPLLAGSNLVVNGDFQSPDPKNASAPLGWDRPDGLGVQWTRAPASDSHGMAMRLDTRVSERDMNASWARTGLTNDWFIPNAANNAVAETYGLSFYSQPFAMTSGTTYRVTCDVLGPSGAKVWVRGYGNVGGIKTRRYEAVLVCYGSGDTWRTCSLTFVPTQHTPDVTEMRVMLYAYYPAGVYWFDNVRVEAAGDNAVSK